VIGNLIVPSSGIIAKETLHSYKQTNSLRATLAKHYPSVSSQESATVEDTVDVEQLESDDYVGWPDVAETFKAFCRASSGMDSKTFAKLCKDSGLLDRKFTVEESDIIFAKTVQRGQRRINLLQFEAALWLVADKKEVSADLVRKAVRGAGSPLLIATKADAVRQYDSRRPHTPSRRSQIEVQAPLRTPTPSRSFFRAIPTNVPATRTSVSSDRSGKCAPPMITGSHTHLQQSAAGTGAPSVVEAFRLFCGASHDMNGKTFTKLCKDCGLVDRRFSAFDSEEIFARVVRKGQRRIELAEFEAALRLVAERKSMDLSAVREFVAGSGGPTPHANATQTVHSPLAMPTVDVSLSDSCDASTSTILPAGPGSAKMLLSEEVQDLDVGEAFALFCGAGVGMDGKSFAKLCHDCHLFDKRFSAADADLVFAKVVLKGQRRISLQQFDNALELVAERKRVGIRTVRGAVALCDGPRRKATQAEFVRLHDGRSGGGPSGGGGLMPDSESTPANAHAAFAQVSPARSRARTPTCTPRRASSPRRLTPSPPPRSAWSASRGGRSDFSPPTRRSWSAAPASPPSGRADAVRPQDG